MGFTGLDGVDVVQEEVAAAADRVSVNRLAKGSLAGEQRGPPPGELVVGDARDLDGRVESCLKERQGAAILGGGQDVEEALIGFEQGEEGFPVGFEVVPREAREDARIVEGDGSPVDG
jgi:hypothetical protein